MFGEYIKQLRTEKRLGLRDFCLSVDYDASNWSKIERGLLPPPQDEGTLTRIGAILGLSDKPKDMETLFDFAAIDAGKIPKYVLEDAELVKRLPVFFRTASGKKPSTDDLSKLAEILKQSP